MKINYGIVSLNKIPLLCVMAGVVMNTCMNLMANGEHVVLAAVVLVANGVGMSYLFSAHAKSWVFMGEVIKFARDTIRVDDNEGLLRQMSKWQQEKHNEQG